ncbi:homoserine O-acetyltransferase MetX [Saccharopolyspora rosea]|uniref:Homoserine O-acetyltransferase n=1 Tax=Saccharopolyspora rosea TaxID=524884 RepID=A0ABW3FXL4_9PSEU|nr:homoserine O-acetyltransferase [Saccharopolyspora rosea]
MSAPSSEVTGAWRDGDPVGRRRFVEVGDLPLERGGTLPGVRLAYETWGALNPARDNAVLVLHAMSGDSHATGAAGPGHPSPGWWRGVVGPGLAIDTDRWFVVCPNALGGCQGSTGPSTPAPDGRAWGSRWPGITIRDQVAAEAVLADALGVPSWAAAVGGSMGGMRALEWSLCRPDRVDRVVVLCAGAEASADQVATCRVQIDAIRADPNWHDGDYYAQPTGPVVGLAVARRIAHLTYRSAAEIDTRFGRAGTRGGDPLVEGFAVESWLEHTAATLVNRFDAGSYVALTEAMNTHDIGRGRGGAAAAVGRMRARATIAGVGSDRLYPLHQQTRLAELLGVPLHVIDSRRGHDGFLVETDQVGAILERALG